MISQTYTNYTDEVVTTNTARFIYDSWGTLQGFILNNSETYLYVKNLQGDIIAIVDEFGEVIVEYSYDAWGNVTFSESSLQNMTKASTLCFVSPFAYRGYCYDYDIELYYLQSRYYSAEIGRFINTDDTQIAIATQGTVLGANLFAYCENNPVVNVDYNGKQGFSKLLDYLGKAVSFITNLVDFISDYFEKELDKFKKLAKSLIGAKSRKNQTKIINQILDQTERLDTILGPVSHAITFVSVLATFSSTCKSAKNFPYIFSVLVAEILASLFEEIATKICEFLLARLPGVKFLIKTVISMGASYVFSLIFTDAIISRMAQRIDRKLTSFVNLKGMKALKKVLSIAFA